ncbi:MAG: ankyrin repeat domain-containing protein [Wolbachia sp.]
MEYDQWLEILSKVNINESNIIDKIKEELKEKDLDTYQKWGNNGFDINYMFNNECTLLHIAALNGCLDIVKYLIEQRHVDVNQADKEGFTALNGRLDIVKYLIENGADVNQANKDDNTALHYAARNGYK